MPDFERFLAVRVSLLPGVQHPGNPAGKRTCRVPTPGPWRRHPNQIHCSSCDSCEPQRYTMHKDACSSQLRPQESLLVSRRRCWGAFRVKGSKCRRLVVQLLEKFKLEDLPALLHPFWQCGSETVWRCGRGERVSCSRSCWCKAAGRVYMRFSLSRKGRARLAVGCQRCSHWQTAAAAAGRSELCLASVGFGPPFPFASLQV
jgi:hypothetical protein